MNNFLILKNNQIKNKKKKPLCYGKIIFFREFKKGKLYSYLYDKKYSYNKIFNIFKFTNDHEKKNDKEKAEKYENLFDIMNKLNLGNRNDLRVQLYEAIHSKNVNKIFDLFLKDKNIIKGKKISSFTFIILITT